MPSPRWTWSGSGSSASCVNGCQIESGSGGILKILSIEIGAKDLQQSFAVNRVEPGNRSDDGNRTEVLHRMFVILVTFANHHDAFDSHFCTAQGLNREQSVINRSQARARGN